MDVCMSAEAIADAQTCGCTPCKEARELKAYFGQVEIGELQINHYESGGFPAGSIAVLKDGKRLITTSAFDQLWVGFIASKKATVRPQDATTTEMSLCPFCKGIPRVESTPMYQMVSDEETEPEKQFYVVCNSCAAQGPWVKSSSAGAIRMWNMRTL